MKYHLDSFIIENAHLVLPDGILQEGSLLIEAGRIAKIDQGNTQNGLRHIDATGCYVLPGIIDLHSDVLEKELEPRPNTLFPTDMVLNEVDKKLAACGVTTMYHSIAFAEGEIGIRSNKMADGIIRAIHRFSPRLRVRTKVHARYEITDDAALPAIKALLREEKVHLLSFMNHTPGQGQFRDKQAYKDYFRAVYSKSEKELAEIIARKIASQDIIDRHLDALAGLCKTQRVPMASHDDDSEHKVRRLKEKGVTIADFPVNMDAARAANAHDQHVCLGAPNVLRGYSQAGNLSARDAVASGVCDVLCSDYAPMTLLHAVFKLADEKIVSLDEAVRMVSINPARAVELDAETGSITEGKTADMIIVSKQNGLPQVLKTFVEGREVFSTCLK